MSATGGSPEQQQPEVKVSAPPRPDDIKRPPIAGKAARWLLNNMWHGRPPKRAGEGDTNWFQDRGRDITSTVHDTLTSRVENTQNRFTGHKAAKLANRAARADALGMEERSSWHGLRNGAVGEILHGFKNTDTVIEKRRQRDLELAKNIGVSAHVFGKDGQPIVFEGKSDEKPDARWEDHAEQQQQREIRRVVEDAQIALARFVARNEDRAFIFAGAEGKRLRDLGPTIVARVMPDGKVQVSAVVFNGTPHDVNIDPKTGELVFFENLTAKEADKIRGSNAMVTSFLYTPGKIHGVSETGGMAETSSSLIALGDQHEKYPVSDLMPNVRSGPAGKHNGEVFQHPRIARLMERNLFHPANTIEYHGVFFRSWTDSKTGQRHEKVVVKASTVQREGLDSFKPLDKKTAAQRLNDTGREAEEIMEEQIRRGLPSRDVYVYGDEARFSQTVMKVRGVKESDQIVLGRERSGTGETKKEPRVEVIGMDPDTRKIYNGLTEYQQEQARAELMNEKPDDPDDPRDVEIVDQRMVPGERDLYRESLKAYQYEGLIRDMDQGGTPSDTVLRDPAVYAYFISGESGEARRQAFGRGVMQAEAAVQKLKKEVEARVKTEKGDKLKIAREVFGVSAEFGRLREGSDKERASFEGLLERIYKPSEVTINSIIRGEVRDAAAIRKAFEAIIPEGAQGREERLEALVAAELSLQPVTPEKRAAVTGKAALALAEAQDLKEARARRDELKKAEPHPELKVAIDSAFEVVWGPREREAQRSVIERMTDGSMQMAEFTALMEAASRTGQIVPQSTLNDIAARAIANATGGTGGQGNNQ